MTHVCTLIATPGSGVLYDALATRVAAELPAGGACAWLSAGDACDIAFVPGSLPLADIETRVREALHGLPVDVSLLRQANRRKKLLLADMDSTIIQQECIDEVADFAGLKDKVAGITERAMRGELQFEPALRERVGLLKGLSESVLTQVFEERIKLMPGARTLVMTMRAHGAYCALVSGGFTFFTSRVAELTGFQSNQANVLEVGSGELTGTVREPILGRDAKLAALRSLRQEHGLENSDTLAVGDGANDLAMIGEAGLGVAYRAKPVVAEQAHARINHGDLTALLYLQGYAREDFTD